MARRTMVPLQHLQPGATRMGKVELSNWDCRALGKFVQKRLTLFSSRNNSAMIHESMFGSFRIGPRFLVARRCVRLFAFILIAMAISGSVAFAQRPQLVVQTGHSQVIYAVAFSPDGQRLVTGGFV